MEKGRLLGISKEPKISVAVIKKEESVPQILLDFFIELGFKKDEVQIDNFLISNKYEYTRKGKRFIDIKKFVDNRVNIKNRSFDIELFFGIKKIIMVIKTKIDRQEEISNKLFKFFDFEKAH